MKKWSSIPRTAALPKQGSVLTLVSAALMLLGGVMVLVKPALAGNGNGLLAVLAGVLLLLHKYHPVVLYRWNCVLAAAFFLSSEQYGLLLASALLFFSSFNLCTNPVPRNVPAWMQRPVWSLVTAILAAVLTVDRLVYLLKDFSAITLAGLLPYAALLVLALSLEGQTLPGRTANPRLQSVPAEGNKLFSTALLLLVIYVAMNFFNGLKLAAGLTSTALLQEALADIELGELLRRLVMFIPDIAACGLLLSTTARKKFFPLAMFLLLMTRVGTRFSTETVIAWLPLAVLLLAGIGVSWNKPVSKKARVAVLPLVAVLLVAANLFSTVSTTVKTARNRAETLRETIASEVESSAKSAAEQCMDDDVVETACETVGTAIYDTTYNAVYDAAYKAGYDAAFSIKDMTSADAESRAKRVADTIAANYAGIVPGMAWDICEKLVQESGVRVGGTLAAQEVLHKEPEEYGDLETDIRAAMQQEYEDYAKDISFSVSNYYTAVFHAARPAADEVFFAAAFDAAYGAVYDAVYELSELAATNAANEILEKYDGVIYQTVADYVIRAVVSVLLPAALLLMSLSLEPRVAKPMPRCFRAVLDWCYQNVGEKLQKCAKVLGAIALIIGFLGAVSMILAAVCFFRTDFKAALILLACGAAALIYTALNIITTSPLYSVAQMTTDVHDLRGGADAAPKTEGNTDPVPVWAVPETPAAEENPDELPEL